MKTEEIQAEANSLSVARSSTSSVGAAKDEVSKKLSRIWRELLAVDALCDGQGCRNEPL
jgi:hypothetical protein